MCGTGPQHRFRLNAALTKAESAWIILKYGEVKSLILLRRAYRQHFHPNNPKRVPALSTFLKLNTRCKDHASVQTVTPPGKEQVCEEANTRVRVFFQRRPKAHIRVASEQKSVDYPQVTCEAMDFLRSKFPGSQTTTGPPYSPDL